MFITVKTENGLLHLNSTHIAAIEQLQSEGWSIRIDGIDYTIDHEEAVSLVAKLQGDSAPSVNANSLVLTTLATIRRDETKNNRRPMWRCVTVEGEKVNVFLNEDDPAKDSFHLFQEANWGNFLEAIPDYSEVDSFIIVAMQKNGQWWEIVKVMPRFTGYGSLEDYEVPSSSDEIEGEDESD